MAKRKRSQTEAIMRNRQAEGRGRGDGAAYKPWLYVHDVPSIGRSSRLFNGGRVMHMLSDWETAAVRDFLSDPDVLDVKEQYPLPLAATQRIAKAMGVRHPYDRKSRVDVPLTTDLLVIRRSEAGPVLLARAIKEKSAVEYHPSLPRPKRVSVGRIIQKLEIERRYWAENNAHWMLLTEDHLSKTRKANLEFILGVQLDPARPSTYWQHAKSVVLNALAASGDTAIEDIAISLGAAGVVPRADVVTCIRLLCRERQVSFDMNRQFKLSMKASEFVVRHAKAAS